MNTLLEYTDRVRFVGFASAFIGVIFYFIFDDPFWIGYVTASFYWGCHGWYYMTKAREESARD